MDPLTHALTGATIGWLVAGRGIGRMSLLLGGASALLPDADIFIRSAADPLLTIQHHRGFTHSIAFAPIGGAVAASPFLSRYPQARPAIVAAAVVSYGSHGILDGLTTYGTQWFWPVSTYRVGLDVISIIDPLSTLVLLVAAIGAWLGRRRLVYGALIFACLWLAAGAIQNQRASSVQKHLARARGDARLRGEVFPTVGNGVIWRSVYTDGDVVRIDRLRVPWIGAPAFRETASLPLVGPRGARRSDEGNPILRRDLERFTWFANGWVVRDPSDGNILADARYSLRADRFETVWGIRVRAGEAPPVAWVDRTRSRRRGPSGLWAEIAGRDGTYRLLPVR